MFKIHGIHFDTKETVIELNGCRIEAYPSHHTDSARGLPNVSFILLDESDYFNPSEQGKALDVAERYIGKSNPYIILVSTPNAPNQLMDRLRQKPQDQCIYTRLFLDYKVGLGKIFTEAEINKAKKSDSFGKEYELKFLGNVGNIFHSKDIERASLIQYDPNNVNRFSTISLGIDPAYGSSNFSITVTQLNNNRIEVLYSEEFEKADYNQMLQLVSKLVKYDYEPVTKIYIDGANPSFIRSLKLELNEDPEYEKAIMYYKHNKYDWQSNMKVLPVNFSTENKNMLGHLKMILENNLIAIDKKFDKLLTSLHTAQENDGKLMKEKTSFDDSLDSLMLSIQLYQFSK